MDQKIRAIGGEFDIDINLLSKPEINSLDTINLYSSGRAALYNILQYCIHSLDLQYILLPEFLCPTIVSTVGLLPITPIFFSLNDDLTIDLNKIGNYYKPNSGLLLINYFGFTDNLTNVNVLKKIYPDIIVIIDNVQSLYSMENSGHEDFSFTSFRKTLPLPDGATVKTTHLGMASAFSSNSFTSYKSAAAILKFFRDYQCFDDGIYLDLFEKGEKQISDNMNSLMSDFSRKLYLRENFDLIASKRKKNATIIYQGIKDLDLTPLFDYSESIVPLFVPIRIKNRDRIRKYMFSKNIFLPIHWQIDSNLNFLKKGWLMSSEELSLIVDQRYNENDMYHLLEVLKEALSE